MEVFELVAGERLGEKIGGLFGSRTVDKGYLVGLNLLADKVMLDIEVLGSCVMERILSQGNGRLVILIDDGRSFLWKSKIAKKMT